MSVEQLKGRALRGRRERGNAVADHQQRPLSRRQRLRREHVQAERRREDALAALWQQPRSF